MPPSDSSLTDAWVQVRVPGGDAQGAQVEFRFNPEYVRACVRTPEPPATRGRSISPESETLLMEDVIEFEKAMIHVAAWLVPSTKQTKLYQMRVDIEVPDGVKCDMFVTLHWNGVACETLLRANKVRFRNIAEPEFSEEFANIPSRDFRLTFEYKRGGKN